MLKKYQDGHVYVADPALGNISFTLTKFQEVWTDNVLFIVFPNGFEPQPGLELTEWDLRLLDERTINQLAVQQFPEFTIPVDRQADRAGSLVRVLTEDEDGVERVLNIPTRTYYKK